MAIQFSDLSSVGGWFSHEDFLAFSTILASQNELGDIVEVGPFLGKCTVVLGEYVRPGESLKVVDLFGQPPHEQENAVEIAWNSYEALSQAAFEANFRRFHNWLPHVHVGESSGLLTVLKNQSVRFAHIDGSHTFSVVSSDLEMARRSLRKSGVIVVDDFRTAHAPGVAAAVWELVSKGLLKPFAITPQKLYVGLQQQRYLSAAVAEASVSAGYSVTYHSVTLTGESIPRISGSASAEALGISIRRRAVASVGRRARDLARALRA